MPTQCWQPAGLLTTGSKHTAAPAISSKAKLKPELVHQLPPLASWLSVDTGIQTEHPSSNDDAAAWQSFPHFGMCMCKEACHSQVGLHASCEYSPAAGALHLCSPVEHIRQIIRDRRRVINIQRVVVHVAARRHPRGAPHVCSLQVLRCPKRLLHTRDTLSRCAAVLKTWCACAHNGMFPNRDKTVSRLQAAVTREI